jgi:hypothetical protein
VKQKISGETFMKKLLLHIFLLIFLVGCVKIEDITVEPTPSPTVVENQNEENKQEEGKVVITIPGAFLAYQEVIDFLVSVNTKGYIESIEENLDGSITYIITKENYIYILSFLKVNIINLFEELKTSSQYPSIKDVTYNEDFTNITFYVAKKDYENSKDEVASFVIAAKSMVYSFLSNKNIEIPPVIVKIKDHETKEILKSISWP